MSAHEDLAESLESFSGRVRLFPLPNLVLFPHVLQPLHVFEPRYRKLVEDALAGDRLIGLVLLKPGWESDYDGRPPIEAMACLGRIVSDHKLDGGEYNILLAGLHRVRLVEELPPERSYREATGELAPDKFPDSAAELAAALRTALAEQYQQLALRLGPAGPSLDELTGQSLTLDALTDVLSYALDLDLATKQKLLTESCVARRAEFLLAALREDRTHREPVASDPFPPRFSAN